MMDTAQFASNWKEMNNDANPIDRTIQQSVYRLPGPRAVESFRGRNETIRAMAASYPGPTHSVESFGPRLIVVLFQKK